jgi:hypothetical protein
VTCEDLLGGEGGAEGEAEDAEGAADLLAFLVLDEACVVGGLGENLVEAGPEAVLGLEGEQDVVGWAVVGEVLAPIGAAEVDDVLLQRGDAAGKSVTSTRTNSASRRKRNCGQSLKVPPATQGRDGDAQSGFPPAARSSVAGRSTLEPPISQPSSRARPGWSAGG